MQSRLAMGWINGLVDSKLNLLPENRMGISSLFQPSFPTTKHVWGRSKLSKLPKPLPKQYKTIVFRDKTYQKTVNQKDIQGISGWFLVELNQLCRGLSGLRLNWRLAMCDSHPLGTNTCCLFCPFFPPPSFENNKVPSWELAYPLPRHFWVDDFPCP